MTKTSYALAIRDGLRQEMRRDSRVFLYGIGLPDQRMFGSTEGLLEEFGSDRVFDTPIAEDSMLGFGLGAALKGMRPVHNHIRVDFLILATNQLLNMVSSLSYTTNGKVACPLTIRAVIGRGWGQGSQHSKSLLSMFAHIPGLKVIAPTTPRDAKGLIASAVRDNNPVISLEHRWLYWAEEDLPDGELIEPIGKARCLREGRDITVIGLSWMNVEALHAARILARHGIEIEVIDPRTLAPLDTDGLVDSVRKTRRCLVLDCDWSFAGMSAEIASQIQQRCFDVLDGAVERLGFAHTPCPTVRVLEQEFYINAGDIVNKVTAMLGFDPIDLSGEDFFTNERRFKGPF